MVARIVKPAPESNKMPLHHQHPHRHRDYNHRPRRRRRRRSQSNEKNIRLAKGQTGRPTSSSTAQFNFPQSSIKATKQVEVCRSVFIQNEMQATKMENVIKLDKRAWQPVAIMNSSKPTAKWIHNRTPAYEQFKMSKFPNLQRRRLQAKSDKLYWRLLFLVTLSALVAAQTDSMRQNEQQASKLAWRRLDASIAAIQSPVGPVPIVPADNQNQHYLQQQQQPQQQALTLQNGPSGWPQIHNTAVISAGGWRARVRRPVWPGRRLSLRRQPLSQEASSQVLLLAGAPAPLDQLSSSTAEFPIFEATSQFASQASGSTSWPNNPASQARCDRPRHMIQADRAVVRHILQSQQNFVIARVPIRRQPSTQRPPVVPPLRLPVATFASLPAMAGGQLYQTMALPLALASNQQPVQSNTVELALETRPSIWQSLVSGLVGSLRSRRPTTSQNTPLLDAAASGAVLIEAPLVLTSRRRMKRQAQGTFSEEQEPMNRLLMLKTAQDDEVCSPIGQADTKIKYSCVPNYCVNQALATMTNRRPAGHVDSQAAYRASQSMAQQWAQRKPQLQVQQLTSEEPLVTYAHLNAYEAPALSRLVQPQHQQFVGTVQALDALGQEEAPVGGVTFGTGLNPASRPLNTKPALATDRPIATMRRRRPPRERPDVDDYQPVSGPGPSEFVAAVDEDLERPIRVTSDSQHRRQQLAVARRPQMATGKESASSGAGQPTSNSADEDDEDEDEEQETELSDSGPPDSESPGRAQRAAIPEAPGSRAEAAGHSLAKTRRHFAELDISKATPAPSSPVSHSMMRYGARHSTPLPAPEKPDEEPVQNYLSHEDSALSQGQDGQANQADCDCPRRDDQTELPSRRLSDQHQQHQQVSQHQQLGPGYSTQSDNAESVRPMRPNVGQFKERRRSEPPATTRRPYNLRNTTYKNLLSSAGSAPPVRLNQTAEMGVSDRTSDNRLTQFDEPLPPKHVIRYEEPEVSVTAGQQNHNALPAPQLEESSERTAHSLTATTETGPTTTQAPTGATTSATNRTNSKLPASVNEILAVARRRATNSSELLGGASTRNEDKQQQLQLRPRTRRPAIEESRQDEDHNGVTPHQYQVQVRWNNSSDVERSSERAPVSGHGTGELQVDHLRENQADRLYEHREEDHWHDKRWLRGAKRRKLVNGRWQETPTEVNEPTSAAARAQEAKHFAIPTKNFRHSGKFLDWVQRDIDLGSEPAEPTG